MQTRFLPIAVMVLGLLTVDAARASAEWFGDLYAGAAFTENHDLKLTFVTMDFNLTDLRFDRAVTFGGRAGYWFERLPYLGLALDVSHFQPDIGAQEATVCGPSGCFIDPNVRFSLSVTIVSLDAMVRWPLLTNSQFPHGRLQPYLTVGPAIFFATGKDLITTGGPTTRSDSTVVLGPKVGAGLLWQLNPTIALFAEYRFTHFTPEFTFHDVFVSGSIDKVTTTLNTHHLMAGLSLRF